MYVPVSESKSIDCTATGIPQPEIEWKLPCGEHNEKTTVLANGTLVITDATVWDSGIYECVAFSVFGNVSSKVHVVVPDGKSLGSSRQTDDGQTDRQTGRRTDRQTKVERTDNKQRKILLFELDHNT